MLPVGFVRPWPDLVVTSITRLVLSPYSAGGAYVNFMMDEGDDRIRATYGKNYDRLARIKKRYDPTNFFRVNQNIKPAK